MSSSNHSFYSLVFFFLFLLWSGLSLCYLRIDLFAALLWIVELSIIIVFLIFFIFISNIFSITRFNFKQVSITLLTTLLVLLLPVDFLFSSSHSVETTENSFFLVKWLSLYDHVFSDLTNDFWIVFFCYTTVNFIEFIVIGSIISIACIIATAMLILLKKINLYGSRSSLAVLSKWLRVSKFVSLRHQCFYKQQTKLASVRLCKKPF